MKGVILFLSFLYVVQGQTTVNLGTAGNFAVLAGSGITNTGPSSVYGSVGSYPTGTETGAGTVTVSNGGTYLADANNISSTAKTDLTAAFVFASALTNATSLSGTSYDLGGTTLTPGVYDISTSGAITGVLTLNYQNNANAQFVIRMGSTFGPTVGSSVIEANRTAGTPSGCRVFWIVGTSATLGVNSTIVGNILAASAITLNTGAKILNGSALARNTAVAMDTNTITSCSPTFLNASTFVTSAPTTSAPTNASTTAPPTTSAPTNATNTTTTPPTTSAPTNASTTQPPTTAAPTNATNTTTLPPTTVTPTTLPPTTAAPTTPPLTNTSTYVDLHVTQTGNYSAITNTTVYCNQFMANISTASHTLLVNYVCLNVSSGSIILDIRYISTSDITPQLYGYIIGNISANSGVASVTPVCNTSITYDTTHPCYVAPATTAAPTTVAPTTLPPTTVAPTTLPPTTSAPTNATISMVVLGSSGYSTTAWIFIGLLIGVVGFGAVATVLMRSSAMVYPESKSVTNPNHRLSTFQSTEDTKGRHDKHQKEPLLMTTDDTGAKDKQKKARISALFESCRKKN